MAGSDGWAVFFAAAAAVLFALASNVQRTAAAAVPISSGGAFKLQLRLLRTPRWLLGSGLAVVALGLHTVALTRGGVIMVQAVLSAGLVVALVVEAVTDRSRMRRRELVGGLLLVAGVVALLGGGRPGGGRPVDATVQVVAAGLALLLGGIGLVSSGLKGRPRPTAILMGLAGGACFALDAVFLRGLGLAGNDLDAVPALSSLAGFVLASAIGNTIVQRAYQRAPLRVVLPAVSAADPLAAFVVGRWLLDEHLQGGPGAGTAVAAGLVAMGVGIVLTTSGDASRAAPDR